MKVCVLREMAPKEVRRKLEAFTASYVLDWEEWLQVAESDRVSKFASILRRWQATRPSAMRRPKAEASHEPPYIEDLLEQARGHLGVLGDLSLIELATATPAQITALHGLWAVFERLSQKKTTSCVGITKAILLLTVGRIGPAFDSTVRKKLGLKDHLRSSEEWVQALRGISEDILAFEKRHGTKLADVVPDQFGGYHVGRLYDMVLGPRISTSPPLADSPSQSPQIGPYEQSRATCNDHDPGQYVALKRRIISEGVTDRLDYSIRKGEFIAGILRDRTIPKVNLREKLTLFHDHWSPKVVGELNGQHVKLVKFLGEFVWHKHDHEDELFLVIKGRFRMEFRDRHVWLEKGEFLIVPRGIEHRPVAEEEVHVLLFEPAGTLNTGNVKDERTVREPQRI